MLKIVDKYNCCGCSSCVQKCPKGCISMKEDNEGFLYPYVDESQCVDCGICEKVCPLLNPPEKISPLKVLAVKNRNEKERMASSSGGVFIALAKEILLDGGIVFGAVFDEHWEVKHVYADDLAGVRLMMGSKYLQSRIGNCYQEAEKFLKEGRKVLFSGTPCQVTGLHKFLRKAYPNLISVDFLCHGVPSPGVWRRYLQETFYAPARRAAAGKNTVLSRSLKSVPEITGIEFRDKQLNGWKKYSFVVRGVSADKADKNSVLLSNRHFENPFMRGFLANIYLRPSCYDCKCKNGVSHSDITIADFWGINHLMPDFDDDKGVGMLLIGSDKGQSLVDKLDLDTRQTSFEDARKLNGGFREHIEIPYKRKLFFVRYDKIGVSSAVETALHISIADKIIRKMNRKLQELIGKR